MRFSKVSAGLAALVGSLYATSAFAQEAIGVPRDWQIGLQQAASPVKEQLNDFHNLLLIIITLITLVVMALIGYASWRYRESNNAQPSRTSHNTPLEVMWTVIPVIILVIIAVPSFRVLYYMDRADEPEMTLRVTGFQWYWGYEYPDHGDISFQSFMIPDDEIGDGQYRLLETDNHVVLPVDTDIQILITAADVLHSWAIPAFGVKTDAVPGRINETWVRINEEGMYYGQCSEICGTGHGFMPISIQAVSKEEFERWSEEQIAQRDGSDAAPARLAQSDIE